MIYIIKQIWVSPLENKTREALGYSEIGYVESIDQAEQFCAEGRDYDVNDCWAIQGKLPEYIYVETPLLKTDD